MQDINRFIKNNFNKYHIIGMVLGVGLSMIYWAKSGHLSDNWLKSSPVMMAIWGLLVGYMASVAFLSSSFSLSKSARSLFSNRVVMDS